MQLNPALYEAIRRDYSAQRLLWITSDRVFYAGLLGSPATHSKCALAVFVALEGQLRIRLSEGEWQPAEVAVVPPNTRFSIACEARHVLAMLIEPELVNVDALPAPLRAAGAVEASDFAAHFRQCHAQLVASGEVFERQPEAFDLLFFGEPLPERRLDPRVARALDRLCAEPVGSISAERCAAEAGLSFSRFLHLFKAETGQSFRALRAWKRARSLLHHVRRDENLVHVALDIGYPDSTHFSHSIRQTYGLKPRDIFAGSRKLRVIGGGAPMGLAAG